GDGPSFRLISIEYCRRRPTVEVRGEQPRQIHRIGNTGIHAVASIRRPEVGRIAREKDAPVAKSFSDQAPSDPVLLRNDLIREVRADAENRANAAITIYHIKIELVGPQKIENHPKLAAVNRDHIATQLRIERICHPGSFVLLLSDELRGANEGRLHAHEFSVALQLEAEPPP